jgi:hypothetical protein
MDNMEELGNEFALRENNQIQIPGQRRGLKTVFYTMPAEVQSFFTDLPALIDSDFSLDIALAYTFFRLEQGQRLTLYCGARKLHRTDSQLTWKAIDTHDLRRGDFKHLFKTIYNFSVSQVAEKCLADAQSVRDDLMHGRQPEDGRQREAICKVLFYCKEMNELIAVTNKNSFRPITGDLRGIVGRLEALDPSTTRWILKGMGFSIG